MWAGAVAGAAEASQRLFVPLTPEGERARGRRGLSATVASIARPKPELKVVQAEPGNRRRSRAGRQARRQGRSGAEGRCQAVPAGQGRCQGRAWPRAVVAKAEAGKADRREGRAGQARRQRHRPAEAAAGAAAAPQRRAAAAKPTAAALMPEDFRKPRRDRAAGSARRPQGDLGHRPEAREGAERSRRLDLCADRRPGAGEEVAWVDDYLAFKRPHRPRRLDRARRRSLPRHPPSRPRAEGSRYASRRAQHRPAEIPVRRSAGRRVRGQSRSRQRDRRAQRRASSGGCRTRAAMPPISRPSTIRLVIVNMSVWRDAESLEHFVWNTLHKRSTGRRDRLVRA